ncbi:MAG: hypothetical protein WCV68_02605 [Candidatus Paceibacterota bacterium]|jgi:hypothetical protein
MKRVCCVAFVGLAMLFGIAFAGLTAVTPTTCPAAAIVATSALTATPVVIPAIAMSQTLVAISPAALVTHSAAVAHPAAYADTGPAAFAITGKSVVIAEKTDAAAWGLTTLKFPLAGACTTATSLTANGDQSAMGSEGAAIGPEIAGIATTIPRIGLTVT